MAFGFVTGAVIVAAIAAAAAAGMQVGIALKPATPAELVLPYLQQGLLDMVGGGGDRAQGREQGKREERARRELSSSGLHATTAVHPCMSALSACCAGAGVDGGAGLWRPEVHGRRRAEMPCAAGRCT